MKYCPKCGQENKNYAKFCVNCGTTFVYQNMNRMNYSSTEKNVRDIPSYYKLIYKFDDEVGKYRIGKTKILLVTEYILSLVLVIYVVLTSPDNSYLFSIAGMLAAVIVWMLFGTVIAIPSYIIAYIIKKIVNR